MLHFFALTTNFHVDIMRALLALNKPGPGPGTYNTFISHLKKPEYKPIVIQCFFKGADSCSACEEPQYGDYYKDAKKRRPLCWCLQCFRCARPAMTVSYLKTVRKHRHCCFIHKHIDVENITYHLIPENRVRALSLKEKAMWNKFGAMVDSKGLPI